MSIKTIEGSFQASKIKIAIIVSRWNGFITEPLKEGALSMLKRHGVADADVTVVYCPGAFELPLTAKVALESGKFDGIICLGAVIRGATSHYDHVCNAVTSGIARLNLDYSKPVIFGVLTTDTIEQAIERAGTKAGNKGEEAALALIEMVSVLNRLNG
ncbi:MAG TPA: 6,7-dimethyl-8-ribityllumazine synthase [Bacteroidetes bacterium]|nr:6,7-dimethyl-8-ribityllumazine synthase [Bacteroidota bacterium]